MSIASGGIESEEVAFVEVTVSGPLLLFGALRLEMWRALELASLTRPEGRIAGLTALRTGLGVGSDVRATHGASDVSLAGLVRQRLAALLAGSKSAAFWSAVTGILRSTSILNCGFFGGRAMELL